MTQKDLNKIHAAGKAVYNKIYINEKGERYRGTKDGRLEKISADLDTTELKKLIKKVSNTSSTTSTSTTTTTTTNSYFPSGW